MKRGGFIQRRTPILARKPFPGKGAPASPAAASAAVPVSLEAIPRFPKPRRERAGLQSRVRVDRRQGKRASAQTGGAAVGDAVQSASPPSLAFPKPKRKAKAAPKPIAHSWMRKSARGTKHSRRPRELGFMAFCHARGCELCLDRDLRGLIEFPGCSGRLEFAHLSERRRYDVGDIGACLHQSTHRGIDGKEGGKALWYVALDRSGQKLVRMRLANRARRAWDELAPNQRAEWDRVAADRFPRRRAA